MSEIGKEIEAAVETAVPGLSLAKSVAIAVVVLLLLVFGWYMVWKTFLAGGQAQAKHDEIAAHAQQLVGQAAASAGAKAANVVASDAQKEAKVHEITRDHYVEITKAAGAGDPVPDAVWDAFQHAVCVRASAAGLPDCQRLQKTDSQ